jgi:hypothetical protein
MGPRIYPSDQSVSQLLPTPTPIPGGSPTPTPTLTPTPTPTPLPSGIPIIQSGLTLYMDGQSLSYPGTGTTWYNQVTTGLTYGNSIITGTTPTFNKTLLKNYFSFNGLNDFTYNTSYIDPEIYGYYWTFGGWINVSLGPTNKILYQRGNGLINGYTEFYGASLILYKNSNDYLSADVWNNVPATIPYITGVTINSSTKLTNDTWVYITMRYNYNSNAQLFINGTQVATSSVPSQGKLLRPFISESGLVWNAGINTGNITPTTRMNIGDFEIYNRSLSDSEILSNYNIQKYKYI